MLHGQGSIHADGGDDSKGPSVGSVAEIKTLTNNVSWRTQRIILRDKNAGGLPSEPRVSFVIKTLPRRHLWRTVTKKRKRRPSEKLWRRCQSGLVRLR